MRFRLGGDSRPGQATWRLVPRGSGSALHAGLPDPVEAGRLAPRAALDRLLQFVVG